jgi:hypothetical protein
MLRIRRRYEYRHVLATSEFDLKVNKITFSPDINGWGRDGWEILYILRTAKDGVFDIFLKRTAGFNLQLCRPSFLRRP